MTSRHAGPSVFDRLYSTSTASSASRLTAPRESAQKSDFSLLRTAANNDYDKGSPSKSIATASTTSSPSKSSSASPSLDRRCRPTEASMSKQRDRFDGSPKRSITTRTSPPKHIRADGSGSGTWTLVFDSMSKLDPNALHIASAIEDYELGLSGEWKVAKVLISALFQRDCTPGENWEINPATVQRISSGKRGILEYAAEKQATAAKKASWDWKEVQNVASAKGIICFDKEKQEIQLRDYSYSAEV